MRDRPKVGILALQGAVGPHEGKLRALGVTPVQVRRSQHLEGLKGIILPGGESTTMIHLLKLNELWDDLKIFVRERPTWGVCAGAILLARTVTSPSQQSLEAMDIEVERNAYGRQRESFISALQTTPAWSGDQHVEGVFIRAPRIRRIFGDTKALLTWHDEAVMVEEGNCLASTFHPELTDSSAVHRYFLGKCGIGMGGEHG